MNTAEHTEHACCQHGSTGTDKHNPNYFICLGSASVCSQSSARSKAFSCIDKYQLYWSSHAMERVPAKALGIDFSLLLRGAWGHNILNRLKNENKVLQTFPMACQWKVAELVLICKNYSDFSERRRKVCSCWGELWLFYSIPSKAYLLYSFTVQARSPPTHHGRTDKYLFFLHLLKVEEMAQFHKPFFFFNMYQIKK